MDNKEQQIVKSSASFLKKNHNYKKWAQIMVLLAAIVLLGTLYSVMENGKSKNYYRRELKCNVEIHEHTSACVDDGEYVCGYADYVIHTHNDDCYDDFGNLVCKLPEIREHVHDSDCYETEKSLICEEEESKGHKHSSDCYEEEQGDLECGKEEHTHDDSCYETDEEGNTTLICDEEEHTHHDDCYGTEKVLVCGQDEGEGSHKHDSDCYEKEKILTCDKSELHKHTKSCKKNGRFVCGKVELLEHTHTSDCFVEVQMSPEEVEEMNREGNKLVTEDTDAGAVTYEEEDSANGPEESTTEAAEEASTEEKSEEPEIDPEDLDPLEKMDLENPTGDTTEASTETPSLEETIPADRNLTQTANTDNYEVTVYYSEKANIPKEAILKVEEIDRYTEPERWAEKQSEYEKEVGQGAEMKFLLNIGFYIDDEEVEPEETVSVTIKYLNKDESADNENSDTDEIYLVHFGNDGTEILDGKTVNEDGSINYETSSFSDFSPIMDEGYMVAGTVGGGTKQKVQTLANDSQITQGQDGYNKYTTGTYTKISLSGTIPDGDYVFGNIKENALTPISTTIYDDNANRNQLKAEAVDSFGDDTITGSFYRWHIQHVNGDNYYIYIVDQNNVNHYLKLNYRSAELTTRQTASNISRDSNTNRIVVKQTVGNTTYKLMDYWGNGNFGACDQYWGANDGEYFGLYTYSGPSTAKVTVTFDGTNGGQSIYTGAPSPSKSEPRTYRECEIGEVITLPEADSSFWKVDGSYNPVKLVGWYDIGEKKYYKPGDEFTVTQKTKFYADWVGADYNHGGGSGLGGIYPTLDTSGFVGINIYDYNDLYNANSCTTNNLNDKGWSADNNNNSYLALNDYWGYGSKNNSGQLGHPNNRSGKNEYTNGPYIYPGIVSSKNDPILNNFFDNSTLGVHYVGSGNHLFYKDGDYYEYDSAKHAASYNQSSGQFTVYNQTQSVGGGSTGFAPLNGESSSYPSHDGQTNYWFGMKVTINFTLLGDTNSGSNKVNGQDMVYSFSGDDDVWIFVDDQLVLDIGGVHQANEGTINFNNGTWTTGSRTSGSNSGTFYTGAGTHTITMFYMERGADQSNCKIRFLLKPSLTLGVQKIDKDNNTVNLQGAEFILKNSENKYYSYNAQTGVVWKDSQSDATVLSTNSEGSLGFGNIEEGNGYSLIEVTPPSGYKISFGTIGFNVVKTQGSTDSSGLKVVLNQAQEGISVDDNNKMTIKVSNERINQLLQIKKTDGSGMVEGAVFRLFEGGVIAPGGKTVTNSNGVKYYISDSNGYLYEAAKSGDDYTKKSGSKRYLNLKSQITYYLQEIKAPAEYRIDSTIIPICVADDGMSLDSSVHDKNNVYISGPEEETIEEETVNLYTITFENQLKNDYVIDIYKIDNLSKKALSNAVFEIYRSVDSGTSGAQTIKVNGRDVTVLKVDTKTTSDNGLIYRSTVLETGTYYLIETKAPDGYNLMNGVASFHVEREEHTDSEGITTYSYTINDLVIPGYGENGQSSLAGMLVQDSTSLKYTIKIPNSSGYKLPATGGLGTGRFYFTGLALILFGGLLAGINMRRKKEEGSNA